MYNPKNYGDAEPANFEWPAFKNDKQRIACNTDKYCGKTISEAFACEYGLADILKASAGSIDYINNVPAEVNVNDVIEVTLSSNIINGNCLGVTIDAGNIKENIECRNNLTRYKEFIGKIALNPVKMAAKVLKKDAKRCVVDVIEPLYDKWVEDITTNNMSQYCIGEHRYTYVKNLKLVHGGYIGQAEIPAISDLLGVSYTVDAFIPGSQIVLNIESDFSKWIGKDVYAFVTNFVEKDGKPMAICSCKKLLQFVGNQNLINLFKYYTEDTTTNPCPEWRNYSKTVYMGVVTGIINSSKKCGVFVEVPELNITGMIVKKPQEVVKYCPQQSIAVCIVGFEVPTYYNADFGQIQHLEPYVIEDGILKECALKPIFKEVAEAVARN